MKMTMTFLVRATAFAALVAMAAGNEIEYSANEDESCSADRTTLLQAKVDIAAKTFTKGHKGQCEDWCDEEEGYCEYTECGGCSFCGASAKCEGWCDKAEGDCQWSEDCGGCSFCGAGPTPPPPTPPTPPPPTSGKCEDWCEKAEGDCQYSEYCGGCSFCGAGPTPPPPTPPTPPPPTSGKCQDWCDKAEGDCQLSEYCGGCSFCGASPTPAPPTPPTPPPPTPPGPPGWNFKPMRWIPNLSSPFHIQPCAQIKNANGDLLLAQVRQTLASEQKTKCIQVFGTLIAGTAGADSNAMRYSANIIAQLLDPNCDGTVDDPNVAAKLDKFNILDAGWINYGTDAASEASNMQNSFSSQIWKAPENSEKPSLALEEAFHMVHQMAWAEVYPDAFGYKDWGHNKQSVACLCMREAQCIWYQHPENGGCIDITGKKCYNNEVQDVFKSGTIPGTCAKSIEGCSNPSCDCLEFFHKVETTWLGNKFNGYERMGAKLRELQGQGLTQRAALEKLLSQSNQCSRLLQHMKDPKMALPTMHIKETYQCGR